MSIAAYKQIISVQDFINECPDLSIHTNETILSAIYRSSEFLNFECDGLINDVWVYMSQTPTPTDTTNEFYRTPTELEYIKTAIVTQTAYFISNGNTNNIGSDGFSLDGFSFNQQTPTSRQALAPNVQLYLTKARVYKTFVATGLSETSTDTQATDELKELLSAQHIEGVGDNRYVRLDQPLAKNGSIATVNQEQVIFEPLSTILNGVSIGTANNANNILDTTNNQYTSFENNTNFLTLVAKVSNNVSDIATIQVNLNTLNQNQQEIINGLANGGLLTLTGAYDSTHTYQMGNIVTFQNEMYVSIINNNTQPLTDTTAWQLLNYKLDTSNLATIDMLNQTNQNVTNLNNQAVKTSGNQTISGDKLFSGTLQVGQHINLGYGGASINISAEDGTNKTINWKVNGKGQISHNFANTTRPIQNLPDPVGSGDAANKNYVDTQHQSIIDLINNSIVNVFKYMGVWNSTTDYVISNVVSHNNILWLAQANNTNSEPMTGNADWVEFGGYGGTIDLNNYYTKPETDNLLSPITTNIANLQTETNTINNTLSNKANTEYVNNNFYNKTYIDTNYPINNIVKNNVTNTFTANQVINGNGAALRINAINNSFVGVEFYNNSNQKTGFFGKENGNNNFWVEATSGNLKLVSGTNTIDSNNNKIINVASPTNNQDVANKQYVDNAISNINNVVTTNTSQNISGSKTFTSSTNLRGNVQFGTTIQMGYGGASINISAEDGTNKTINWKVNGKGQISHNFANTTRPIQNLPDPVGSGDAANKNYVDTQHQSIIDLIEPEWQEWNTFTNNIQLNWINNNNNNGIWQIDISNESMYINNLLNDNGTYEMTWELFISKDSSSYNITDPNDTRWIRYFFTTIVNKRNYSYASGTNVIINYDVNNNMIQQQNWLFVPIFTQQNGQNFIQKAIVRARKLNIL